MSKDRFAARQNIFHADSRFSVPKATMGALRHSPTTSAWASSKASRLAMFMSMSGRLPDSILSAEMNRSGNISTGMAKRSMDDNPSSEFV